MLPMQAQHLHYGVATHFNCPFGDETEGAQKMTKPIEKLQRRPLVHHPSDALDSFGQYDATSRQWIEFDDSLSEQIAALEAINQRYIRVTTPFNRRSSQ